MKPVFQTKFGYPTGNCFAAAVASVLELESIPDVDPTLPESAWIDAWAMWFTAKGLRWLSFSYEPDYSNWGVLVPGYSIANVEVHPGIGHSVVFFDGEPVHDVAPGSPFLALHPLAQREYRILAFSQFEALPDGETSNSHWAGAQKIPGWIPAMERESH
jgi:hypothetical protein